MELRVAREVGMCEFIFAKKTPEKLARLREVAGTPDSSVQEYGGSWICNASLFSRTALRISGKNVAKHFKEVTQCRGGSIFRLQPLYETTFHIHMESYISSEK